MVQHGRDDPAVVEWRQKSGLMKNKIKKQKTTHRSLQGTLKKHYFLCGCSGTIWTDYYCLCLKHSSASSWSHREFRAGGRKIKPSRYNAPPEVDRLYLLCERGEMENDVHFLFCCLVCDNVRDVLFTQMSFKLISFGCVIIKNMSCASGREPSL